MILKKFINGLKNVFSTGKGKQNYNNSKDTQRYSTESYDDLLAKVRRLESIIEEQSRITDNLKSAFLKNIYHEIRTPMNSIVGFTSLLEQKNITDKDRTKYTENIKKSSKDFLKLIDDLVEASLLNIGEIKVVKDECDLKLLINNLYSCFTDQHGFTSNKNITFLKNPDSLYEEYKIYSDSKMLFDIMSCIISNAFKFTQKGIIEYGYKVLNDYKLMFYVKDTGVGGIDEGDTTIFKIFTKSEHCYDTTNKGFGLGLNIARSKVTLLGGEIWVESNELKGTTFKFTMPVERIIETAVNENKTKSFIRKPGFSIYPVEIIIGFCSSLPCVMLYTITDPRIQINIFSYIGVKKPFPVYSIQYII
jgi:signal transduction histidine kinase